MIKKLSPLDARIPEWNFDEMVKRDCPLCRSADASPVYERPDGLTVRFCAGCGTYFISPVPPEAQLNSFYANYDETHRRMPDLDKRQLTALYSAEDPFSDVRIRELRSLMDFNGSRVLDVGFGRGFFLYSVKKAGGITYGLEVDRRALQIAEHLGIDHVTEGVIQDYECDTDFDLITMMDLVEHPQDPLTLLKKAAGMLKNQGFLLIWTPNGDHSRNNEDPVTFRVDLEHMQYLTANSCIFIASELNLRIVHLETIGYPSLAGIDKPLRRYRDEFNANPVKRLLRTVPGFYSVNKLRRRFFKKGEDERGGSYHLFCIMQRVE